MAQKLTDTYLWKALTETVIPLSERTEKSKTSLPLNKRGYKLSAKVIHKIAIPDVLDLHGLTVQEAFDALTLFLERHQRAKTSRVEVITGKGKKSQGLIKSEILKWADNPRIGQYVKEMTVSPDGGAVFITLKKDLQCTKKKCIMPL